MQDRRVARRYAAALFATALRYDVVKSVEEDLAGIVGLLSHDKGFRGFLLSPYVGREEKLKIAEKLFSDRVTALTMQALRLMLEKRREGEVEALREEFVTLRRRHDGVIFATVSSAEALDKDQQKQVVAKVGLITGKAIEPHFLVDPRLIGGVKVAFENIVLDGTLRGSLNLLGDRLRHDVLMQT
ncbi:MAG: ATP synthase F1 subunit delta [Fimbriimonas ginsengisoli]|uniref:ATP synthase subunit delta n=1 Tax=Fimbriimonas ginsengisoli TaxID=1005039 RepID=A0A931PW19_FIMGI|nr:ATP synthase F1 subunit delta [Fimbriimonas ginsengisoli]